MMGHKGKKVDGDEQDALSHRSKKFHGWAAGMRKLIKRKFNKRQRRKAKEDMRPT